MASNLKTPVFDWNTMDFAQDSQGGVKVAYGSDAMEQIAIKAQQTPRGKYLIYADPENLALHHKYGSDAWAVLSDQTISDPVRISELRRATREAILYDPWIKDVGAVDIYQEVGKDGVTLWYADFTITSIWDETTRVKGAALNG